MAVAAETIKQYQAFFEDLTDENVERYRELATSDVRYSDPLIDSKGIDNVIASMHKWFKDLNEIQFQMNEHAVNGQILFQHWNMQFRIRKLPKRTWNLEGMSKVTFDEEGKAVDHIDYWDLSPMMESVPILGGAVKLIKRILS